MPVVLRCRVVRHRHSDHIFGTPPPKLADPVDLQSARIRGQDYLRSLDGQDAGTLGELPVVADHCADSDWASGGVDRGDREVGARCQRELVVVTVAGVNFGIGELDFAVAVDQREAVARGAGSSLEIGDRDRDPQVARERMKSLDEGAVAVDRETVPG